MKKLFESDFLEDVSKETHNLGKLVELETISENLQEMVFKFESNWWRVSFQRDKNWEIVKGDYEARSVRRVDRGSWRMVPEWVKETVWEDVLEAWEERAV